MLIDLLLSIIIFLLSIKLLSPHGHNTSGEWKKRAIFATSGYRVAAALVKKGRSENGADAPAVPAERHSVINRPVN
jgi:hypothetical protein